jgi:hypothetical protein
MNEILAMILIVFATERVQSSQSYLSLVPDDLKDLTESTDKSIVEKGFLVEFLLDPRFMQADVFMAFDRTLKMGIQDLYMDTKDITNLRLEIQNKESNSDKAKQ